MTVSDLLEQPCNKSDSAIKLVRSCQKLVPNLLQQLGTSSAKTTCWQLVNRFVTTCLQTCNNLCVFTCVGPDSPISCFKDSCGREKLAWIRRWHIDINYKYLRSILIAMQWLSTVKLAWAHPWHSLSISEVYCQWQSKAGMDESETFTKYFRSIFPGSIKLAWTHRWHSINI
jgi:hypothetical protein